MSEQDNPPSAVLFPLRTNASYCMAPQEAATLIQRAKLASILHDQVFFEDGLYVAVSGASGGFHIWTPPDRLTAEILQNDLEPTGGSFMVKVQLGPGQPGHTLMSGAAERRFRSEFHTLLHQSGAESMPWIRLVVPVLPKDWKEAAKELLKLTNEHLTQALSDMGQFLRSCVMENLSHDLLLSVSAGVGVCIDPYFEDALCRLGAAGDIGTQPVPGFLATSVAVPNAACLDWHTIAGIREDPALFDFRRQMRAVERLARQSIQQDDVEEVKFQISQVISDELLREVMRLWPTGTNAIHNASLQVVLGLLPVSGPIGTLISTGVTLAQDLRAADRASHSWLAAFMKLRSSH